MANRIEYKRGDLFGNLIFIKDCDDKVRPSGGICRTAIFLCYCGNVFTTNIEDVKARRTRSCGCWRTSIHSCLIRDRTRTHGKSSGLLYSMWSHMKQRCLNPNSDSYSNYGGRGIKVCDNWIERFESYYKHVASLPDFGKEGYTLDRTDNDGNYEPGNVRWASRSTQARNQRKRSTASGYRGVVLNERDEVYQARISLYLGSFKEKKDALSVVNCFIIKHGINNLEIQKWEG